MTKPVTRKMAVDCILDAIMSAGKILNCRLCGSGLLPGQDIQFDHIHADVFDGPHEYQNLRPVHYECHKKKTAQDIKANAKIKRLRGEVKGRPKRKWASRPMQSRPFEKRKT